MADFSIANLKTVKDAAAEYGMGPDLEARFAKGELAAEHLGVSYQRLAPLAHHPLTHRHKQQPEELYVVLSGDGVAILGDERRPVQAWDVIHVAGPVVRSFEAGATGIELLAFGVITPTDETEQL